MKIKYIGFPMKDGCHVDGADMGIEKINKKYELNKIIQIQEDDIDLNTILNNDILLASEVDKTQKEGFLPVSIGGDHSLAIGSIAGSAKNNDNLGVIWLDTHPDINTLETTTTYNIHGYPLAASMGFGIDSLTNLYFNKTKVKYENVVLFGIDDIDEPERQLINELSIRNYSLKMIKEKGIDFCINDAIKYLESKTNQIHLSFDLDSINTGECPGVNVPNRWNNGITKNEALTSFKMFLDNLPIKSIDIVEYNPINDSNDKSLNIVLEAIKIINQIKK